MTRVVVSVPRENAYSETFIRAHIERLPADVIELYGTNPTNLRRANGEPVVGRFTLAKHAKYALQQRFSRLSWDDYLRIQLIKFLRTERADVVLAHYGATGLLYVEACSALSLPLVVNFHGYDAYQTATLSRHASNYRRMFSTASALVAVSKDMVSQLEALGADPRKILYNPYGVDLSLFSAVDPEMADPVFLAVGRFGNKKAPLLTLLAFRQVLDAVPQARLIMIGDGPLRESCMRVSQALGMEEAVDFPGICAHAEIIHYMKGARAFVQHSVRAYDGDSEGTPNSIMEASGAGLPVVSTCHGGIPDAVVHGETGFLVEEGDIDLMAQYMVRLARQPALAATLGRAGRERIRAEFSIENSIGNLWALIQSLTQS